MKLSAIPSCRRETVEPLNVMNHFFEKKETVNCELKKNFVAFSRRIIENSNHIYIKINWV